MHPSTAMLVAFCDAETGPRRSRRVERHLAACGKCRDEMRRIRTEKAELSAVTDPAVQDQPEGLAGLLSAISAWRADRDGGAQLQVKRRIRNQVEQYCGAPAAEAMERTPMAAEEWLGKSAAILEVFLGPAEAQALTGEALRGIDPVRATGGHR